MVYYEHYKVFKEFILFLFYLSMLIDNVIWHARVGSFYALKPLLQYKSTTRKVPFSLLLLALSHIIKSNLHVHYVFNCTVTKNMGLVIKLPNIFFFICIVNLLCPCGDIETNPVPKYSSLTFCNWNLNGLTAHDSTKILLIHAYILQHNYDICLSQTLLNSSIESNDDRISTDEYNLVRLDCPSDLNRGGVCIYNKERIPLIKRDNICTLENYLVKEISSKDEKFFLTCIYRSPSQSYNEFQNF